jgi:hypothetical protein
LPCSNHNHGNNDNSVTHNKIPTTKEINKGVNKTTKIHTLKSPTPPPHKAILETQAMANFALTVKFLIILRKNAEKE